MLIPILLKLIIKIKHHKLSLEKQGVGLRGPKMGDKTEIGAGVEDSNIRSWREMARKLKWTLKDYSYYELVFVNRETLG